jgi:hypothetical protein
VKNKIFEMMNPDLYISSLQACLQGAAAQKKRGSSRIYKTDPERSMLNASF